MLFNVCDTTIPGLRINLTRHTASTHKDLCKSTHTYSLERAITCITGIMGLMILMRKHFLAS